MNLVSRDEARTLIGKMLFGSDWIAGLTKEQLELLNSDFGPKRKAVFQAGVMVNTIDIYERACPPEHRERFNVAVGYSERMRLQGTTVDDWIETVAGLDCTQMYFQRVDLDRAMAQYRDLQAGPVNGAGRRGPAPAKRDRVAEAMKDAIAKGQITRTELAGMKEEAMAQTFSASRETVRNARDVVLSELRNETPTNTDSQSK
jgi:hypothetical protein